MSNIATVIIKVRADVIYNETMLVPAAKQLARTISAGTCGTDVVVPVSSRLETSTRSIPVDSVRFTIKIDNSDHVWTLESGWVTTDFDKPEAAPVVRTPGHHHVRVSFVFTDGSATVVDEWMAYPKQAHRVGYSWVHQLERGNLLWGRIHTRDYWFTELLPTASYVVTVDTKSGRNTWTKSTGWVKE